MTSPTPLPRFVLALFVGALSASLFVVSLQVGHADVTPAAPAPPQPQVVVVPAPSPQDDAAKPPIAEVAEPAQPPAVLVVWPEVEQTLPVEDFGGY